MEVEDTLPTIASDYGDDFEECELIALYARNYELECIVTQWQVISILQIVLFHLLLMLLT